MINILIGAGVVIGVLDLVFSGHALFLISLIMLGAAFFLYEEKKK